MPQSIQGIYNIRRVASGKAYVGSSRDIHGRFKRHRHMLRHGKHFSAHLQAAWNLYGEDGFSFTIVEIVADETNITAREQAWVDALKANDPVHGYNRRPVVDSRAGVPMSEDAKRKISEAGKGRIMSDKTRSALRAANLGKKHSEETKRRMSESKKGRPTHKWSEEERAAFTARRKGKPLPPEWCAALSEAHKGIRHTPESRAKISAALRGKTHAR